MAIVSRNGLSEMVLEAQRVLDVERIAEQSSFLSLQSLSADSYYSAIVANEALAETPGVEKRHLTERAKIRARTQTTNELVEAFKPQAIEYNSILNEIYWSTSEFLTSGCVPVFDKTEVQSGNSQLYCSGSKTHTTSRRKPHTFEMSFSTADQRYDSFTALTIQPVKRSWAGRLITNLLGRTNSTVIRWSLADWGDGSWNGFPAEGYEAFRLSTAELLANAMTCPDKEKGALALHIVKSAPKALAVVYANAR